MNRLFAMVVVACLTLLAGCTHNLLEGKKVDYKSASNSKTPQLEVPPDLTTPGKDDRYAVPDVGARGGSVTASDLATKQASRPKSANPEVLPQVDKIRMERSGSQRWLVVPGRPDQVWSAIRDFWQENGFLIKAEKPEAGVMETDWAENRAKIPQGMLRDYLGKMLDTLYSTPERDMFRTRLEAGAEPNTTEVYISHRGMYEIYVTEGKSDTRWQPRPPDPDLEAEMLRRVAVRFGSKEEDSKVMTAKIAEKRVEHARLDRAANNGPTTLVVEERFDRAWRRVGLALDRVGFTVEDRDRSRGFFFVRYVDPEADNNKKEKGFLDRVFVGGKDKSIEKLQYRLHVKDEGARTSVQVLTREGGADGSDTARKILSLLHEQLK